MVEEASAAPAQLDNVISAWLGWAGLGWLGWAGLAGLAVPASCAADQIVTIRKFSHLQIGRGLQLVGWALIAVRSHRRALPLVFWGFWAVYTYFLVFWLTLGTQYLKECRYIFIVHVSTRPTFAELYPAQFC